MIHDDTVCRLYKMWAVPQLAQMLGVHGIPNCKALKSFHLTKITVSLK